ncbi:RraA-like protein [Acrodontium crateriforme]|uniref:RraA-like protein n=1 Tax=Acrodontium crateriforme TaxID=150365 RepID=A0AAQ3LZ32_9PEZI|nr:RraA-like protein [Acrodontium crateriforme]
MLLLVSRRASAIASLRLTQTLSAKLSRNMSSNNDLTATCRKLSEEYSACDVSDALLKLKVPQAGFLPDIVPIHGIPHGKGQHVVAPVSTVLFVPKSGENPQPSNIPTDKHWTDIPPPSSIVLLQQPAGMICAVLGDIMATRLKHRGVRGIVANGRIRDIASINELCADGTLSTWSKGYSTVGTGLEAKAWAVDVPVQIGGLEVRSGDILCADENERGVVVIPQDKLDELMAILPALKATDDKCVADVQAGVDVNEVFRRHR